MHFQTNQVAGADPSDGRKKDPARQGGAIIGGVFALGLLTAGLAWLGLAPDASQETPPTTHADADQNKAEDLIFGEQQSWCSIPVRLEVTHDYLEFLLVNPHGGVHESLFSTEMNAQVLNTAFLAMGLTPGKNVSWEAAGMDPLDLERVGVQGPQQPGAAPARDQYKVIPPQGDSLYLYAAWTEGEETFFFRVEDLIRDLDRERTLRRHPFVYLGSFMTAPRRVPGENEGEPSSEIPARFAAEMEGILIYCAFFRKGAALLTTAVEECDKQTNWLANSWLLPKPGSSMRMVFSKQPMLEMPSAVRAVLPKLPAQVAEPDSNE